MSQGGDSQPLKRRKARRADAGTVCARLPPGVRLRVSPQGFWRLCAANPDLRLEREANGELIVMPPAGSETGYRNAGITGQLWYWNQQSKLGVDV